MKPEISRRAGQVWSLLRFKVIEDRLEALRLVDKASAWGDLPEWLRTPIEKAERAKAPVSVER